jgi:ribosomal protein L32
LTTRPGETQEELVAFAPEEIQAYFEVLCRGFHKGELTFNQIKELLEDVRLYDRSGILWTIGAKSGKWYRLDGDKWVNDTPQGALYSAYRVYEKMAATGRACPKCTRLVSNQYRFCPYCGSDMENPQPAAARKESPKPAAPVVVFCRNCGKKIKAQARFCNYCGTARR